MATRLLLHLRSGASAAARSVRGHHLPGGRTWDPATAPSVGALADAGSFAGRIPAVQGLRYYRAPFNRDISDAELRRAMRKVKKRLGVLEEKPSVEKIQKSNHRGHEKFEFAKEFHQFANVAMVVGYSITFGALIYHYVL